MTTNVYARRHLSGSVSVRGDDRAVSTVIGAVVLLVIAMAGFSLYQVYGVTSETKAIEFKHSQAVREDLLAARNAIFETKRTGESTAVTVDLAPAYPARAVAINPPPPSGTIETTENGTITVHDKNGQPVAVCPVTDQTRLIEYAAQYNEFTDDPTIRYENTVLYADYGSGRIIPISGQKLVEGRSVTIIPILSPYRESGSEAIAFEPRAGQLKDTRINDPTLFVPTRLPESEWETLLADEVPATAVTVTNDQLQVQLSGTFTVSCGPVAVNSPPPGGQRNPGGVDINPAGPGSVEYRGATIDQNDGTKVYVTFNNSATDDTRITDARIAFYFDEQVSGGKTMTSAEMYDSVISGSTKVADLQILAAETELSTPITLAAQSDHVVPFVFNEPASTRDFFIAELRFANGERGTYFIGMDGGGTATTPTGTTPAVSIDGVNDRSRSNQGDVRLDVSWSASDGDADIVGATAELRDAGGTTVASQSYTYTSTASIGETTNFDLPSGYGNTYTIVVTVTDAAGNQGTAQQTEVADGT